MFSPRGRHLPTELFEHILDEVYNSRHLSTLKNCSLVNNLFCSLSQRRLLRHVVIKLKPAVYRKSPSPDIPPAHCEADELLDVLQLAPHLSEYIHVLTVRSNMLNAFVRPGTDHWIASDPSLRQLVQTLTHLRSFRVKPSNEPINAADLKLPVVVTESSQRTVFDSMPPTLTELALALGDLPSRYYQSCHWIKNLSISSLDCTPQQTLPAPIYSTLHLQRLQLSRIPDNFLSWLSTPGCPIDPGYIEKLTLTPIWMDDMKFIKDVGSRMTSVHEIRIDTSQFGYTAFACYNTLHYVLTPASLTVPDLQSFNSLTTLSFSAAFFVRTFQHHQLIDYFANPLTWIRNLVSSLPSGQFRVLALDFSFESSSYGFPHEVVHLLRQYWAALHTTLLEKQPSTKLAVSLTGLDTSAVEIVKGHLTSIGFAWHFMK